MKDKNKSADRKKRKGRNCAMRYWRNNAAMQKGKVGGVDAAVA